MTQPKKKLLRRIVIIAASLCLVLALLAGLVHNQLQPLLQPETHPKALFTKAVPTTYPYVFVHGLNGWGTQDNAQLLQYWGATSCYLMEELQNKGYTCVAPSGGPAASAWDRACELYAALTGTTVDYGEAHAKAFGHERYGEVYTTALLPEWGKLDADGNLQKINLIGHSFGGAAVRLFAELLANGSGAERTTSGADCSPLFAGGKADWVFSLTALTAPHNGTTILYAIGDGPQIIGTLLSGLELLLNSAAGQSVQEALNIFGFDIQNLLAGQSLDEMIALSKTKDNAYYDLTLQGAKELNERISTLPEVYYFSLPADATRASGSKRVPTNEMFLPLRVPAAIIGAYSQNKFNDIPIDASWLPNDGLVNTVSEIAPNATAPSGAAAEKEDFSQADMHKGVWMVYPTLDGDHGKPIGLMQTKEWTLPFYTEQMERIDSLSRLDTAGALSRWLYGIYQRVTG